MLGHRWLTIKMADRMDADRILVEFSDGSMATYTVEELVELRPIRCMLASDVGDAPDDNGDQAPQHDS